MKTPGPSGIEWLRAVRQFQHEPLALLLQYWRRYGDVIRLPRIPRTTYIISHPDHVGYILQKKNRKFNKQTVSYNEMRKGFGKGLITVDGDPVAEES